MVGDNGACAVDDLGDRDGLPDVTETVGDATYGDGPQTIQRVISVGREYRAAGSGLGLSQATQGVVDEGLAGDGRDAAFLVGPVGVAGAVGDRPVCGIEGLDPATPAFAPGASDRLILPLPVSAETNPAASSGAPISTGTGVLAARRRPLPPLIALGVRSIASYVEEPEAL